MQQHQQTTKRQFDPLAWVFGIVIGVPIAVVVLWLVYLFISVVFLGGSSACPQNLC